MRSTISLLRKLNWTQSKYLIDLITSLAHTGAEGYVGVRLRGHYEARTVDSPASKTSAVIAKTTEKQTSHIIVEASLHQYSCHV